MPTCILKFRRSRTDNRVIGGDDPDYQTVMLPLLSLAADAEEHRLRDAIEELSDHFNLTEVERKPLPPVCNTPPHRRHARRGAEDRAGNGLAIFAGYNITHWYLTVEAERRINVCSRAPKIRR